MNAKGKVTGVGATKIRLQNIAEKVAENSRKVMNRESNRIVADAWINCPEDDGSLASTIRAEKSRAERNTNGSGGRLVIDLTFGGVSPATGRDTDPYAMRIHENYEGMLVNGPGEITRLKQAMYPDHIVGSHFLTRAADDRREVLMANMIDAVAQGVAGGGVGSDDFDVDQDVAKLYGNDPGGKRPHVKLDAYAAYVKGFRGSK